ncbi:alpha/beta fold hydrolase [Kitasatospora sp. Ki12]|uniref:thioesterase II family protein n=1 Tax=Kitasatospora xanthocidica TaxID=83382 RepID=UPI0016776152|nr:alpha/beta fold hydrolase [Kitasatospora xanthocidica]GHF63564.1 thioesterase [Kitasatospora xanthocidica]
MTGWPATMPDEVARWTPWHRDAEPNGRSGPVRVYCLPHAGGSASVYLPWARETGQPDLTVVPVELPGRGTRLAEPPAAAMDEVVDGVLAVLASRPADEPFILLGHSMGARIGYETARRLAVEGRPLPLSLVVTGARPPGTPDVARLHDLTDDDLMERLVELGGTPAEVLEFRDLMRMALPVLRADVTLLAEYNERTRPTVLPCPVLALGGDADLMAGPEWITGWRSTTAARFRHRILPGDHFFPHQRRSEVLAELAAEARAGLEALGG